MNLVDIFTYVFGFLCIYLFLYVLLGFFFKDSSHEEFQLIVSRSIDIFTSVVVLTVALTLFFSLPNIGKDSSIFSQSLQEQILSFLEDPWSMAVVAIVIAFLYLIIYLFRIPMTPSTKPFTITLLENGSWVLIVVLIIQNVARTFLNIDLVDSFVDYVNEVFDLKPDKTNKSSMTTLNGSSNNIDEDEDCDDTASPPMTTTTPCPPETNTPKSVVVSTTPPPPPPETTAPPEKMEVFNIAGNHFTYEEAPAVCAAYGAKLATYDQVEEAYEKGGEWCNYGWSADQMAFFPTQKQTWEKLQKNPATAHQCGRPGVNGGYMMNPDITFGVNCYGVKPPMSERDEMAMKLHQQTELPQPVPLTAEQAAFQAKMEYWKQNAGNLLTIHSFNEKKWSEF